MIRIWTPAERDQEPGRPLIRGLVEHIGEGQRIAFRGPNELIAFLELSVEQHPEFRRSLDVLGSLDETHRKSMLERGEP